MASSRMQVIAMAVQKQQQQPGGVEMDILNKGENIGNLNDPVHEYSSQHKSILRVIPLLCKMQCFHLPGSTTPKTQEKKTMEMEKAEDHNNVKRGGWKTMPYIIGNESCEKLATLGAFISDSYIGRFWTIGLASVVSLFGMVLLALTAIVPQLRPPPCRPDAACVEASQGQIAVLLSSFAMMTIGAGGIRPCSLAFGADQFDYTSEKGRRSIQSFFNWYYLTFTVAMMITLTIIVYVQENISWSWGLGIPASMMIFSVTCFFMGARQYIHVAPEGSSFTSFAQVMVATYRKRHLPSPATADDLYDPPQKGFLKSRMALTDQFRFLNKAAIITQQDFDVDGRVVNPWRLCSVQQVEELKSIIRIVPIWSSGIVIFIGVAQLSTFSILQARTMDRHIGKNFQIPAGSFGVFTMLALTIWLPVYDRLVVPMARRVTGRDGGITLLQRMGTGLLISLLSMGVAGIVEIKRRKVAVSHGFMDKPNATIPMSALWLTPQYCLAGLAEGFNAIGQIEFLYSQFPENMRSVAGALFFCSMAVGNYMSSFVVTMVHRNTGHNGHRNWLAQNLNQAHLEYFYWLLAGIGAVNFVSFIICARWYKYKVTVKDEIVGVETSNLKEINNQSLSDV
eukprot:Gb_38873 [translate_table: standard]